MRLLRSYWTLAATVLLLQGGNSAGDDVFARLAAMSGGRVIKTDKSSLSEAVKVISESIKATTVILDRFHVKSDDVSQRYRVIHVDGYLPTLRVELTSDSGAGDMTMDLLDPTGVKKDVDGQEVTEEINVPGLKVLKVLAPAPGFWSVHVSTTTDVLASIDGSSSINFQYSLPKDNDLVSGKQATMTLEVTGESHVATVDSVILMDHRGNELNTYDAKTLLNGKHVTTFQVPDQIFYTQLQGTDINGNVFTRLATTPISPLPASASATTRPIVTTVGPPTTTTLKYTKLCYWAWGKTTCIQLPIKDKTSRGFLFG